MLKSNSLIRIYGSKKEYRRSINNEINNDLNFRHTISPKIDLLTDKLILYRQRPVFYCTIDVNFYRY